MKYEELVQKALENLEFLKETAPPTHNPDIAAAVSIGYAILALAEATRKIDR